jgi:hypothetical protein
LPGSFGPACRSQSRGCWTIPARTGLSWPTPADLAAVADQLERVIAEGEPQKSKALLRLLIQELRVGGRAQIQPTYRLITPEVCATSEKVERTGIEPVTSGLQILSGVDQAWSARVGSRPSCRS